MTAIQHYQGVEEILARLAWVQFRRRVLRLATAGLAMAAVVMVSLVVMGAGGGYWSDQPPLWLRWGLLLAALGAWLAAAGRLLITGVLWRQTPAQVARFVEQNLPELRNDLINTVLLSGDSTQPSPELVQAAIREALHRSQYVDVARSLSRRALRRAALAALAAAMALGTFAFAQNDAFRRGLFAAFLPSRYVPHVNKLELVSLKTVCLGREFGPDATFFAGDSVTVVATVGNEIAMPYDAQLLIEGQSPRPMTASNGNCTYSFTFNSLEQTFRYAVRIGSSRWPTDRPHYEIRVLTRVSLESAQTLYKYPLYTKLADRAVAELGAMEAPQGSVAQITIKLGSPVPSVVLDRKGAGAAAMTPMPDRVTFAASVPIDADGEYRLVVQDSSGRTIQQFPDLDGGNKDVFGPDGRSLIEGYYRIHAVSDAKPKIDFITPNKDVYVGPGGTLPTKMKLWDDYGIEHVQVFIGRDGQEEKPLTDLDFAKLRGTRGGELDYAIRLGPEYKKGDVLVYYAALTDNRSLPAMPPQTSNSAKFKITVQDAAEVAANRSRLYEELRRRMLEILRLQEPQRVNTEICARQLADLASVTKTGGEILSAQQKIRAELMDLVEHFQFEPDMAPIQQALSMLATSEAQLAVEQAQAIARLADLDARPKACSLLGQTQDKIIDTLQTLLAIMPSLQGKSDKAQTTSRPAGDLPPDVKEKLEALKQNMDEFIKEQKKVVEATERLSKKPVDNFDDQKLLKDLQAAEDKWEKFLNEAFADFSKMAEQDFSNPAMLKELVSVKTDVTMAKDALAKKANEIATAAEDNGIENAKSLTANIEKWLPDTPDRTKWAMEDPPGGQDKVEAPELPKEMEDLVGDLLEQEEDLFQEMEDVTSKYNMSGDKGIGWDAMDGPISNMNAQGVTGNQLPNNMELSGRSGEGREGKSSGEFVQDSAEGKGGRRTPTRLTPEPFQKGQVDDKSQEPAGGSTGGGKLSGAGGEGLEGPVPPPLQKELQRLAGKQASLINKAEGIKEQFKQADYSGFNKAIMLMNRVEEDLAANRYQNALRQKDVTIGALQQSKLLLTGKVDVQTDTSTAMPKYVRDDIADAMKGKLPPEYREALEQYYRRLSEEK